jgi:hypothetical protein
MLTVKFTHKNEVFEANIVKDFFNQSFHEYFIYLKEQPDEVSFNIPIRVISKNGTLIVSDSQSEAFYLISDSLIKSSIRTLEWLNKQGPDIWFSFSEN